MTTKLTQKDLFKGTREFELVDDVINIRMKRFNKEETLSVMLTVLNPEPVIGRSSLEFTSRVNGEPLVSLYLAKPNPAEFNAFVALLKQRAQDAFNDFAGLRPGTRAHLAGNVDDEPPEFDTADSLYAFRNTPQIAPERLDEAIRMLETYVGTDRLGPFIEVLETLRTDPTDETALDRMIDEFKALGPSQGAVLTYAPYIGILLSDYPAARP
jgi:hypothetical protein